MGNKQNRKPDSKKVEQIKQQILRESVSLLIEGSVLEVTQAKRKAAQRFGIKPGPQYQHYMPSDEEVEFAATMEKRLLQTEPTDFSPQPSLIEEALHLMLRFEQFSPKLSATLFSELASTEQPIEIHLYPRSNEEVAIELMQQGIPFEIRNLQRKLQQEQTIPCYCFFAGDREVRLEVYSGTGLRIAPQKNGKRIEQLNIKQLREMLEHTERDSAQA